MRPDTAITHDIPQPDQAGQATSRVAVVDPTENWVVPLRAAGAALPLFCVCAGGGDVFDYRDLALALPEDQPVYVFGLPPAAAGAGFPTVQQLAAIYVHEMCRRQPRGPYRLCGHSFGGLVVYEMAAQLAETGEQVGLLGLIDTLHPSFRSGMSPAQRRQFRTTYIVDRLAKYARNLASGRIDRIAGDVFDFVWHRCKRTTWRIMRVLFGRGVPEAIRSDEVILLAAWHRYVPGRYGGRLVLLNAADRPAEYGGDATLGWKACVAGPIETHVVPGNHYTIMHPPHVADLAMRLAPYLAGA
jgi:thioesterase domain-containing protein